MAFNFCQFFILFGLLLGAICIAVLLGSSTLKRKSNFFLSMLIFCFIANLGQYWLEDVGLISYTTMQLIFVPWQMLIAPLFLLYVYSLRVFNHFPFRQWVLFLPFAVALAVHIIVKALIIREGIEAWTRPEWVSTFYLVEELMSILYCLLSSLVVYRWIWLEKKRSNYMGFGVNKEIVKWINTMMKMGLILAIIWTVSLYVVNTKSNDLRGYYLLWCLMAIVLNILGFVGIFYSLKEGKFSEIDLSQELNSDIESQNNRSEFRVSAPNKYFNDTRVNSLFALTSQLTKSNSESTLYGHLSAWFKNEFSIDNIHFELEDPKKMLAITLRNRAEIPIKSEALNSQSLIIDLDTAESINEADFYFINMAAQAFGFHQQRLTTNSIDAKIKSDNKVYRSLLELLENEDVYTDPMIDLSLLSNKLNVSAGYLSKVINDAGNKSFNELINDYRIKKVKQIMEDDSYDHYTVVGYGLEAGFNSKSTFYKAFQKREGVSPGKYYNALRTV